MFVSRAGYPLSSPRGSIIYGGKRWVFRPEKNRGKDVQDKSEDEAEESSKQWEQKTEGATAIVRGDPGND